AATTEGTSGPRLSASWIWAGRHLAEDDVRAIAAKWQDVLEALATQTARSNGGGHTPSDFPRVRLEQAHVDALEARCGRSIGVLPLSPLQEGLIFHALYDRDAPDVYTVQLILDIAGALDDQRLHAAADAVVQRHHNLRASFHHDGLPQPVQVIAGDVHAQWRDVDLSADPDPRAASAALVERDRLERFDQTTGPLIR